MAKASGVWGEYWINSMSSLRYTTLPGVAPMLTPTSNSELSTCEGHPSL